MILDSGVVIIVGVGMMAGFLGIIWVRLYRKREGWERLARVQFLLESEIQERQAYRVNQQGQFYKFRQELVEKLDSHRNEHNEKLSDIKMSLIHEQAAARQEQLDSMSRLQEQNMNQLVSIRQTVSSHLHEVVEQQMQNSFQRVLEQFSAVQKAMGEVSVMTSQLGDLKRLFANIKTRGSWGEAQLKAILDDILPPDSYESNCKIDPNRDDVVEFAIHMPVRGDNLVLLPIDSKFPITAYERLITAFENNDSVEERKARGDLERTVREEARKITKYIQPPRTVEYAVMYVPTDGLYAEIVRIPGLVADLVRKWNVMLMGPGLIPAMLKTIHLGYVTLQLGKKTDAISRLLAATKQEMAKMDDVLEKMALHAARVSNSIEEARRRTRVVSRKLRDIEQPDPDIVTKEIPTDRSDVDEKGELPISLPISPIL